MEKKPTPELKISVAAYKDLVKNIITKLKELDSHFTAHRIVFDALIAPNYPDAKRALETARNSPQVQTMMHEKYDVPLEKFLSLPDGSTQGSDLLKWFQEWNPSGPIN